MHEVAAERARSPATAWVFINHRGGCAGWAVHIDNALSARFGADRVFRASRSIQPGEDFVDRILATVAGSKVVVALIGPDWVTVTDKSGGRALDSDSDWVRREIEYAITAGIPVLPVLVDDAPLLHSTDLPDPLAGLARRQYLRMNHRSAQADTERVCAELVRIVPELRTAMNTRRGRRLLVIMVATVVAAVLGIATLAVVTDGRPRHGIDGRASVQSSTAVSSRPVHPWITVRPTEGAATSIINVKGAGFPAWSSVALSISSNNGWLPLGRARTDSVGEFVASFDLRLVTESTNRLVAGVHVVATDVDGDPDLHTTSRYTVVNG
jgi:hypothetical protein